MLIKMPNGKMIVVTGDGRHCIQVLDTNSGECIAKATEEASGWSSHARNFAKRWRVLCAELRTSHGSLSCEISFVVSGQTDPSST